MSHLIRKSHNVSILVYHFVCPAKYRRAVIDEKVDQVLKDVCLEIAQRYQIEFLEIGTDKDHVHFLVQSVPSYSPTKIITIIKSFTAREVFVRVPSVKKQLWGGEFWTDGYYVGTVGRHATEEAIRQYFKNQGKESEYVQLHVQQLKLF
ncbi:MAG: IS200/IS605 family transposase [Bacteroidota bacterium]